MNVRIEDHHMLMLHVRSLCRALNVGSISVLWQHEENNSSSSIETLRGIVYETCSFEGDDERHERFHDFIKSSSAHERRVKE